MAHSTMVCTSGSAVSFSDESWLLPCGVKAAQQYARHEMAAYHGEGPRSVHHILLEFSKLLRLFNPQGFDFKHYARLTQAVPRA
jgi:hypothetical protein